MSKTWTVFKHELITTVTRRSFLLTLILLPLIPGLIIGVMSLLGEGQTQTVQDFFAPTSQTASQKGYVDQAGLIQSMPTWLPEGMLIPYPNQASAQADIIAGKIGAYYVIPPNYIESGEVAYYRQDANPVTGFAETQLFDQVIRFNLLGGEGDLYQKYEYPVFFQFNNLTPEADQRDENNPLTFYLPYGVTMLFYIVVIMSATFMLNNIGKEKENRVIEILMSSVEPLHLFTGKIIALGLAGLLQMLVWFGSGMLILRLGGTILNIPENIQLPPSLLIWGVLFFLLGYGLYGSLMAGVGAMVPNLREASQATFLVIIPVIIPLMFISILIDDPNGILATIISIFPFTAPVAMMTRLAVGGIPWWQPLLAALLLLGTVILIIRSVARLFRAQTLLTGQKFSSGAFLKALLGRNT